MPGKPIDNRQYTEMLSAARDRMRCLDLGSAAVRAGLCFDEARGVISFESFGTKSYISCTDLSVGPGLEMWQHLVILQYLETADGGAPTDTWISMSDLPDGGLVRGSSFDREIDSLIASHLSDIPPERITEACSLLGGELRKNAKADLCVVFHFLPLYPLMLNIWFADDEFAASGKVLINRGVSHCLGTEATGTAAELLVQKLTRACISP